MIQVNEIPVEIIEAMAQEIKHAQMAAYNNVIWRDWIRDNVIGHDDGNMFVDAMIDTCIVPRENVSISNARSQLKYMLKKYWADET